MSVMLKYKYPMALVLAASCAVGAVFLTKYYFDQREQALREELRKQSRLTDVVVARRDLKVGERIDLKTMEIKSIPYEFVPDGAIKPEQYPAVEMKHLGSPVSAGKPLLRHFVEGIRQVEKFSDLLAAGERAITLEVDGIMSVEHMIQAGDFIDLAVRKNKGKDLGLLLERAKVLSTGNYTISDPIVPGMYKRASYSTLTLGVDGKRVQDIFEAQSTGNLVFLLRNEKDMASPTYELSPSSSEQVVVLSGTSSNENGVLTEVVESISDDRMAKQSPIYKRNEKGRIIRIADEQPSSNRDTNNEVTSRY